MRVPDRRYRLTSVWLNAADVERVVRPASGALTK
jgi:hypothetical protein